MINVKGSQNSIKKDSADHHFYSAGTEGLDHE